MIRVPLTGDSRAAAGYHRRMAATELTFIGTATTLLRLGPFAVLTDPNFLHRGERAHLGYGLTSRRLTEPALQPAQLPRLDGVVLSHLHGDHWDHRATSELDRTLPVLTTPHAARRLHGRGFGNSTGLATWQAHSLRSEGWQLTVTALPGKHAFGLLGRLLPPVMGSLLELIDPGGSVVKRLYLSGDTLVFDGLGEIARRHPDIELAVLHLGGTTLPGGFVVTMDGEAGARLCEILRPRNVVPVHHDDYGVFKDPLAHFRRAMYARDLPVNVREVARGDSIPI